MGPENGIGELLGPEISKYVENGWLLASLFLGLWINEVRLRIKETNKRASSSEKYNDQIDDLKGLIKELMIYGGHPQSQSQSSSHPHGSGGRGRRN